MNKTEGYANQHVMGGSSAEDTHQKPGSAALQRRRVKYTGYADSLQGMVKDMNERYKVRNQSAGGFYHERRLEGRRTNPTDSTQESMWRHDG